MTHSTAEHVEALGVGTAVHVWTEQMPFPAGSMDDLWFVTPDKSARRLPTQPVAGADQESLYSKI